MPKNNQKEQYMAYKHDYDKILTRLINILSRLNNGETLDISELAEEFNVSKKTIYRDFKERLVSFPIYQENKKWKMQKGFHLEKVQSLEEELILDIIEKMTESIGGSFAIKSKKLLSKIKNEDFNPIYTKLNIEDITDRFDDIKIIEQAIKEKKEILCSYENEREGKFHSNIQPLKIVNFEGFWYLVGMRDNNLEKYYIKTLSNIQPTDINFTADEKIEQLLQNSISIWFQADNEPFEVKIHADKTAAKYFKRRPLPTQKLLATDTDGSMEFSVNITYEMEIIPIIKYWMPHLRVLEPQWLVELVDEDVREYIKIKSNKEKDNAKF